MTNIRSNPKNPFGNLLLFMICNSIKKNKNAQKISGIGRTGVSAKADVKGILNT